MKKPRRVRKRDRLRLAAESSPDLLAQVATMTLTGAVMSRSPMRKKLADYPLPYRSALAYWCAFRNLGFESDEIFFGFGEVSGMPDIVHLQLLTQGKDFTVSVDQIPGGNTISAVQSWHEIAATLRICDQSEYEAVFRDHLIGSSFDYFAAFVGALQAKGIHIPKLPESFAAKA